MLRLLKRIFSQHGYQVLVASDGEQAIDIYRSYKLRVDIVLLDIGLPKISGRDVFRKMKEENADVRIVIASGHLEPAVKSGMQLVGVKGFVNKPYVLDDLRQTIQDLIAER